MENKFTKGKWKTLDKATFDSYQNVWRKALYIDGFNFCMYISGRTEEEVNANAKLIAAAPEMLDVLSTIENDNGEIPDWLWKRIKDVMPQPFAFLFLIYPYTRCNFFSFFRF